MTLPGVGNGAEVPFENKQLRRWLGGWVVLGACTFLVPSPIVGQWLSAPGEGWLDVSVFYHDTDEIYREDGTREQIFADGRAITRSVFFTGSIGIREGIDVWLQLPFHRLRFDDAAGERTSSGFGDPRGFLRFGPSLFGLPAWPVAVRGGVKLEGGAFDVDAEIIPLGEGQRDWELLVELGRSFYPRSLWTMGWIGYRWRMENAVARRTPGNELFWWWTAGGALGRVGWQASLEGIRGGDWMIEGLRITRARRSLDQTFFQLDYPVGPGRLNVGIRMPLRGQNLPAGAAITSGYFWRWGKN